MTRHELGLDLLHWCKQLHDEAKASHDVASLASAETILRDVKAETAKDTITTARLEQLRDLVRDRAREFAKGRMFPGVTWTAKPS